MRVFAFLAAGLAAVFVVACGSARHDLEPQTTETPERELAGRAILVQPDQLVVLPTGAGDRGTSAVWSQAFNRPPSRTTSFLRINMALPASQLAPDLPRHRAQPIPDELTLLMPTGSASFDQWAYASWTLQLGGYADSGQIQSLRVVRVDDTRVAPPDPSGLGDEWVGLANVQQGSWDFYELPADVLLLDSFAPYTAEDGSVAVTVLARGAGTMSISAIRVGDPKIVHEGEDPLPVFDEKPAGGFSPLAENFVLPGNTKSASSVPVVSNTPLGALVLEKSYPALVDLAPKYPAPRDQGRTLACTGFATSAAMSYGVATAYGLSVRDKYLNNDINHILSVPDIYIESDHTTDPYPEARRRSLRSLSLVLKWLAGYNVPREAYEEFAVVSSSPSTVRSTPLNSKGMVADRTNLKTKLTSYEPVFTYNSLPAKRRDQINQLRYRLSQGKPVVATIEVDEEFDYVTTGGWNFIGANPYYHAMAIVGYDDKKRIGSSVGAFKLLNSYGKRWGDGGYTYIGYDTFDKGKSEIYAWWLNYLKDSRTATYLTSSGAGVVTSRKTSNAYEDAIKVRVTPGSFEDHVHVAWDPEPGASGYYIFRDAWPESAFELDSFPYGWFIAPASLLEFDDFALQPGQNSAHIYRVLPLKNGRPDFSRFSVESERGYPCREVDGVSVFPESGAPGDTLTMTAAATVSCPTEFTWDFGAAASPSVAHGQQVNVQLGSPGTYNCNVSLESVAGTVSHDFTLLIAPISLPITGTVVALDGRPLRNVSVALSAANLSLRSTSAVHSTLTDANGNFSFAAVGRGDYEVRPNLDGWEFLPFAAVNVSDTAPAPVVLQGYTAPVLQVNTEDTGLTVTFDASASVDPDGGGIDLYRWDFDGNGTWDAQTTAPTTAHTFDEAGTYSAVLEAEDGDKPGDAARISVPLNVVGRTFRVPMPSFAASSNTANLPVQAMFDASASADPDGGKIVTYLWDFNNDGNYDQTTALPVVYRDYATTGRYVIKLKVIDDEGVAATTKRALTVEVTNTGCRCWCR